MSSTPYRFTGATTRRDSYYITDSETHKIDTMGHRETAAIVVWHSGNLFNRKPTNLRSVPACG